jgi:prolyl-tRNA synthetase
MMQDGKALQAGTSHFLGTTFSQAQNIKFQNAEGQQELAQTTSWGMSTRMIGGLIMVHGDDDGLRVPPRVAPYQVVVVPMLRDTEEDAAIVDYCTDLVNQLNGLDVFREPVRALLDKRPSKAATKRWGWVKKGAPIVIEVGGRDVAGGNVSVIRRDRLYREDGKLDSQIVAKGDFVAGATAMLEDIQTSLFADAKARLDGNIDKSITDLDALKAYFKASKNPGWALVQWAKPTGAELEKVVQWLKGEKLTLRNVPTDAEAADGACIFTGGTAVERVLVGRSY